MSSINSRGALASINGGGSSIASSNEEQEQTTSSKKNLPVELRLGSLPSILNLEEVRRVKGTLNSAEAGIFTNYSSNPSPRYRVQNTIKRNTTKVLEKACCPLILSVEIGLLKREHSDFSQKKVSSSDYTVRGQIKQAESLVLKLVETSKLMSNDLAVYAPQIKNINEYQDAMVRVFESHALVNSCQNLFLKIIIREGIFLHQKGKLGNYLYEIYMRHREFITFRIASVFLNPTLKLGMDAGFEYSRDDTGTGSDILLQKRYNPDSTMCKTFWEGLNDTCGSAGPFVHFATNYKSLIYEIDNRLNICWKFLGITTAYRAEYQETWTKSGLGNPEQIKSYKKILASFYFTLNDLRLKTNTNTTFNDESKKKIQEHLQKAVASIKHLVSFVNKHPIQLIFSATKDANYIPLINFLYAEKSDTEFILFDDFIYRLNHFYLGRVYYTLYLVYDECVDLLDNSIYPPHARGGCTFASNIHCEELCKAYVGDHVLSPAVFMEVAEKHWEVFEKTSSSFDLSVFAIVLSVMLDIEEKFKAPFASVQPTAHQPFSTTITKPPPTINIKPRASRMVEDTVEPSNSISSSSPRSETEYSSLMSSSQKSPHDDYLSVSLNTGIGSHESHDSGRYMSARFVNGGPPVSTEDYRPSAKQNNYQQVLLRRNDNVTVNNSSAMGFCEGSRESYNQEHSMNAGPVNGDRVYRWPSQQNNEHHNFQKSNENDAVNISSTMRSREGSRESYDQGQSTNSGFDNEVYTAENYRPSNKKNNEKRGRSPSPSNNNGVSSENEQEDDNDNDDNNLEKSPEQYLNDQESISKRHREGAIYDQGRGQRWSTVSSSSSSSSSRYDEQCQPDVLDNERHDDSPNSTGASKESSTRRSNVDDQSHESQNNYEELSHSEGPPQVKAKKPANNGKPPKSRENLNLSNYNENPQPSAVHRNSQKNTIRASRYQNDA